MNPIFAIRIAVKQFLNPPCVPKAPPQWYTPEEMRHYLFRHKYSAEIANELSVDYAMNLQRAFNKGFEMGQRTPPL
jgi:hypothetical protein